MHRATEHRQFSDRPSGRIRADQRRTARAAKRAFAFMAGVASDIKASGDPRGYCLTFRLASGRSNSFGGEVWGV